MSNHAPKCESMSIEEATVSNMWEIAAIVELLERKGPLPKGMRRHLQCTQHLNSFLKVHTMRSFSVSDS